ncbi:MAG: hypothetical protein ACHQF0_13990 [Chitinophagales bacterium]
MLEVIMVIYQKIIVSKKNLLFLILLISSFVASYSQEALLYDTSKISKNKELNFFFTDKRGIEGKNGLVYLVKKDLRTVSAYQYGKVKWTVDVIAICGYPSIGKPEIRYIRLDAKRIYVVFGKHDSAEVALSNRQVNHRGTDSPFN